MTSHLEHEQKYELPVGTDLPVGALPGTVGEPRSLRLVATYYDTADLRLLRAGVTLRRRTGGDDAGWHLKLPAGTDTREEIHRPPGRAGHVPAELSDLLTARRAGAPLVPVALITTRRVVRVVHAPDGDAVAEIASDTVTAQLLGNTDTAAPDSATAVTRWHEVEVEAIGTGGDWLAPIGRALRAAGARRATPAKLARVLASQLEAPAAPDSSGSRAARSVMAYLAHHSEALRSADLDVRRDANGSVHAMRVATRRLRSTLRTFQLLDGPTRSGLEAELRWLAGLLGEVRDREVARAALTAQVATLPPELVLGPVQSRIDGRLAPEIAQARSTLLTALRGERYLALLATLEVALGEPWTGPKPGGAVRHRVRAAYRSLDRRMSAAQELPAGAGRDEASHRARKAAKRARYGAEALVSAAGKDAVGLVARTRRLQDGLGAQQDATVAQTLIRELGVAAQATPGESAFTFGLLLGEVRVSTAQTAALALPAWRATTRRRRWLD